MATAGECPPHSDAAALVTHPDTAGVASLRAKATGSKGNTVEQSAIRAYKIIKK